MWPNVIRRAVIEELGEENSNNPKWLSTMKKIEQKLWAELPDDTKEWYAKRAVDINTGKLALEAKAEWVYFPSSFTWFDWVNGYYWE